jgi:hypothetical protein
MIPSARLLYNQSFSEEKYHLMLKETEHLLQHKIPFRVAETPVFIDSFLFAKLKHAGTEIIDFINRADFKKLTERAIPPVCRVPNEDDHSLFIALDFAICKDESGRFIPQLIEMQGFPSLFAYQNFLAGKYRQYFTVPEHYSHLLNGMDSAAYNAYLKKILLGSHDKEHVILLEIEPTKQPTAIDFIITEKISGVRAVCISDVILEDNKLFYMRDGVKTQVKRIYNRVIFDELLKRNDLNLSFHLTEDVDVEWAGHPNWFFRISKFTMPFIKSDYIPRCFFLNDVAVVPSDLENYVLKPLFSFSGTGVLFHVKPEDIEAIPEEERANYLLQQKVNYEPCIQAPDGLIKCEVRLLYIYNEEKKQYELVTNLARLSRGEMIGTKYNKDKTWVGGTVGFFEM